MPRGKSEEFYSVILLIAQINSKTDFPFYEFYSFIMRIVNLLCSLSNRDRIDKQHTPWRALLFLSRWNNEFIFILPQHKTAVEMHL